MYSSLRLQNSVPRLHHKMKPHCSCQDFQTQFKIQTPLKLWNGTQFNHHNWSSLQMNKGRFTCSGKLLVPLKLIFPCIHRYFWQSINDKYMLVQVDSTLKILHQYNTFSGHSGSLWSSSYASPPFSFFPEHCRCHKEKFAALMKGNQSCSLLLHYVVPLARCFCLVAKQGISCTGGMLHRQVHHVILCYVSLVWESQVHWCIIATDTAAAIFYSFLHNRY